MGCEILRLQAKPAYKQDRFKLEAMIVPNTPCHLVWKDHICPLFESENEYEQKGMEPKGDLERMENLRPQEVEFLMSALNRNR